MRRHTARGHALDNDYGRMLLMCPSFLLPLSAIPGSGSGYMKVEKLETKRGFGAALLPLLIGEVGHRLKFKGACA